MTSSTHAKEPANDLSSLAEEQGVETAAKTLGITTGGLRKMLRQHECRPVYNLAARALMRPSADTIFIVVVPQDKLSAFEAITDGMALSAQKVVL